MINEVVSRLESSATSPSQEPIIIRLSGHVHTNDRSALREIGRQLLIQNGRDDLEGLKDDDAGDGEDEDADGDEEGEDEARALAKLNALLVSTLTFLPFGWYANMQSLSVAATIAHVVTNNHNDNPLSTNNNHPGRI